MSITEKDFARKLSEAFDGREWKPVIDLVAELTGHEFAPEKPEPGTVWASPDGGFYLRIIEQPEGHDAWFIEDGRVLRSYSTPWPALTPARVVPAEPVEVAWLGIADAEDLIEASQPSDGKAPAIFGERQMRVVRRALNAARAKHGHGRVEVSRDEVREAVEGQAKRTIMGLSSTTVDNITDRVMELLEASK